METLIQTGPEQFDHLPPPPSFETQQGYIDAQRAVIDTTGQKEQKAAETMERMDHKNALYAHLGKVALGEPSDVVHRDVDGKPPTARTIFEQARDRRLEKKARRLSIKQTYARRAEKTYGPRENLPGMDDYDRKQAKSNILVTSRREHWSAQQTNAELSKIDGAPLKLGSEPHKRAAKGVKRSTRPVKRIVRQPITSIWRDYRRNRAIGKIQTSHAQAEEARQNLRNLGELDD